MKAGNMEPFVLVPEGSKKRLPLIYEHDEDFEK